MAISQFFASAEVYSDEDRIQIEKDGLVIAANARATLSQLQRNEMDEVPRALAWLLGWLTGRDLYAEARDRAYTTYRSWGKADNWLTVTVITTVEESSLVRARVRCISEHGIRTFREVPVNQQVLA